MGKILSFDNSKSLCRSDRDNYHTPKDLYNIFIDNGYFDPCPYDENYIINGLTIAWKKYCFVNPPFSNIKGFIKKAIDELLFGNTLYVWFLVPCNCDTKWFEMAYKYMDLFVFVNGRIKFNDSKYGAPMSCCMFRLCKKSVGIRYNYLCKADDLSLMFDIDKFDLLGVSEDE